MQVQVLFPAPMKKPPPRATAPSSGPTELPLHPIVSDSFEASGTLRLSQRVDDMALKAYWGVVIAVGDGDPSRFPLHTLVTAMVPSS